MERLNDLNLADGVVLIKLDGLSVSCMAAGLRGNIAKTKSMEINANKLCGSGTTG